VSKAFDSDSRPPGIESNIYVLNLFVINILRDHWTFLETVQRVLPTYLGVEAKIGERQKDSASIKPSG
jgi:hypothetical protein